ncbi:LysR family transcriptional regulator [Faecalimonas umbilicata]|nr:LysR family transcriptional regulator [Faecalimonas umbilicata]
MNYDVINEVCEMKNLTKAAKALNYSQSAVSQTIQNYEKSLGITLFERSKTGVEPLPFVKPIIESIRIIAEEEKRIKEYAESIRDLQQGMVRLGCLARIATKWLPDIFKEFGECYPNIRYEMMAGSFYDLRKNLKDETIDFAMVSECAAKGFAFTPIIKDEMVVLLPKGHTLAEKETINIQDLKEENIIITSEGLDFEIGAILREIGVRESHTRYRFNDDIVIMKFVELGFGVCVLPRLFLDITGKQFDIEIRSFSKKKYRTLGVAYPNKEYVNPAAAKFVDYLLKWFKQKKNSIENVIL